MKSSPGTSSGPASGPAGSATGARPLRGTGARPRWRGRWIRLSRGGWSSSRCAGHDTEPRSQCIQVEDQLRDEVAVNGDHGNPLEVLAEELVAAVDVELFEHEVPPLRPRS